MSEAAKARTIAREYVKQKYGFKAEVLRVELDRPSWLEFKWKKPNGAYVYMEHDGVQFRMRVGLKDKYEVLDSYESHKIENEAKEYFERILDVEKLAVRLEFCGEDRRYVNLAPMEIRSFQDVIKNDKYSIVACIYTYGLREESIDNLNIKDLGNDAMVGISDWKVTDFPTEHADMYRALQEAYDDDLIYLNAHYFIDRQGNVKAQYYDVQELTEDISILTSDDIDIRIEKVYPQPDLAKMNVKKLGPEGDKISERPITPWYRVHLLRGDYKFGVSKAILFLKPRPQDSDLELLQGDRPGIDTRYAMESLFPDRQNIGGVAWSSNTMLRPGDLSNYVNRKYLCSYNLSIKSENMFRIAIRERGEDN